MKLHKLKPTLQAALGLEWCLNLSEALETRFEKLNWEHTDKGLRGVGLLKGEMFEVYLEPGTYELNGKTWDFINLGFAKVIDGKPDIALQGSSKNPSAIIGAITQAIESKLVDYEYDALILGAVDKNPITVKKRLRLYGTLVTFSSLQRELPTLVRDVPIGGGKAIVLLSSALAKAGASSFIKYISTNKEPK